MGEKKGNTCKLLNPYNDNGVLEIFHPEMGKWIRVTSTEFRSWGGKRRITEYRYPFRKPIEVNTHEYEGPVFEYQTNHLVKFNIAEGMNGVRPNSINTHQETFKKY